MLFLTFQLGSDRYALDIAQLVEVLPNLFTKRIPQAAPGIRGVFDYRGSPVPLLDLSELSLGTPSRHLMSTRILLVAYVEPSGASHLLGLLAEQATAMIRRDPEDFVEAGVTPDHAPYLGPVATDAAGIIQRIEINRLLPVEVRDQLFRQPLTCE